jgi:hypothetical protein
MDPHHPASPENEMVHEFGYGELDIPSPPERKITPQRRSQIFRVLKKTITEVAKQKQKSMAVNADLAKLCVLDAFQGRLSNGLANNSKKTKWIYTIFCMQTSSMMFKAVVFASAFHTFSIFLEPANACTNSIIFKLFQWTILLIYALDMGLKMGYEGVHVSDTRKKKKCFSFKFINFSFFPRNISAMTGSSYMR